MSQGHDDPLIFTVNHHHIVGKSTQNQAPSALGTRGSGQWRQRHNPFLNQVESRVNCSRKFGAEANTSLLIPGSGCLRFLDSRLKNPNLAHYCGPSFA
jgi:hypothetical protein